MVLTNLNYTIAWITALDIELAAAQAMLEELHPALQQKPGDTNNYTLGRIGLHNICIACLPFIGNNAAAFAAANLLRSFPNIRIGLMVGVGGGVPDHEDEDIRLGDIVVSSTDGTHGGVLQFDFGTAMQGRDFIRKGYLNKPPTPLLTALKTLKANAERKGYEFPIYYNKMLQQNPMMTERWDRPNVDDLYEQSYEHPGSRTNCSECSTTKIVHRKGRARSTVHYGLIGSSNQVIRDAVVRDTLHREQGIICFEMEAAGLMNDFPCLVIRGICDYCDTHKNKYWQRFASAQAAAFAKELLMYVSAIEIEDTLIHSSIADAIDRQIVEHRSTQENVQKVLNKLEDISKDDLRALALLKLTDPKMDKERLKDIKGGLLRGSYLWILHNTEFKTWRNNPDQKLLWIHGNPGKGKTMLLCGIIEELSKDDGLLSYFFCQESHDKLKSAVSVLRGIIFMLATQQPALIRHLRKYTDNSKDSVFEDHNAWFTLSGILKDCLKDDSIGRVTILIDALDECDSNDRQRLMYLIVACSKEFSAKWIVSSRNWPEIERDLRSSEKTSISLELNAKSVSDAVKFYIQYRVARLAELKEYDKNMQTEVTQYLLVHAEHTFLWVALACDHLKHVLSVETIETLRLFPPGLKGLYTRMLERILDSRYSATLLQILALISIVYRPLRVEELMVLLDVETAFLRSPFIEELIGLCGSFLTIRKSDNCVGLIHQSAKDFVLAEGYKLVFPKGQESLQRQIYIKSVTKLYPTLKRDIYSLGDPGTTIHNITIPSPDPLGNLNYSCAYWLDHLITYCSYNSGKKLSLEDTQLVSHFFKTKFIFWLEASSLLKSIPIVSMALSKLEPYFAEPLLQDSFEAEHANDLVQLQDLVQDATQFVRFFQYALENFPLQVYVSGLLFSPAQSTIKELFKHEAPKWIHVRRGLSKTWPFGNTLECYSAGSLSFSPDSEKLATIDTEANSIRCWNIASSRLLCSIQCDIDASDWPVEYSWMEDGAQLAISGFPYKYVELWCVENGQLLRTVHLHGQEANSGGLGGEPPASEITSLPNGESSQTGITERVEDRAVFSADGLLLACCRNSHTMLTIHSTLSGKLEMAWNYEASLPYLAISPNNLHIAMCSKQEETRIWDVETGSLLQKLPLCPSDYSRDCAFSPDGELLVLVDDGLQLWNWSKCQLLLNLDRLIPVTYYRLRVAVFNPSSGNLVFSTPTTLREWCRDGSYRICDRMQFRSDIRAVVCSPNGQLMAAVEYNSSVSVCSTSFEMSGDISADTRESSFQHLHLDGDNVILLGASDSSEIHVSSVNANAEPNEVMVADFMPELFSISPDRGLVVICSRESNMAQVWDVQRQNSFVTIEIDPISSRIKGACWDSRSSSITFITSTYDLLTCWDVKTGKLLKSWPPPTTLSRRGQIYFCSSPQDAYIAMSSREAIDVLKVSTGTWQNLARGIRQRAPQDQMVFSHDETLLAYVNVEQDLLVWNIATMKLLFTIPRHGQSCLLSVNNHWLKTHKGQYEMPTDLQPTQTPKPLEASQINMDIGAVTQAWIRLDERNLVWLPGAYRPDAEFKCWDVEGDRVAIRLGHEVLILDFLREYWIEQNDSEEQKPSSPEKDQPNKKTSRQLPSITQPKRLKAS